MLHLATDPNPSALQDWSLRNHEALSPVSALPLVGQFLVSRLAVLTPAQVTDMVRAGVELVSCDGLDLRKQTGTGDTQAAALRVVTGALGDWQAGDGAAAGDAAELEALRAEKGALLEQIVALTADLGEARTALAAAHEAIRELAPPKWEPTAPLPEAQDQPGDPANSPTSQDDAAATGVPESGGAPGNVRPVVVVPSPAPKPSGKPDQDFPMPSLASMARHAAQRAQKPAKKAISKQP